MEHRDSRSELKPVETPPAPPGPAVENGSPDRQSEEQVTSVCDLQPK